MQYRTIGGKMKKCELTLHWPEEMTFSATASNRVMAEKMAAALACMRLKVRIFFFFPLLLLLENYYTFLYTNMCITWSRSWSCWIKTTTR